MADKRGTDEAEPSPAATDPAEAPATAELAENLKRERDDYHDRWLRKTAEFDNYRRRVERELRLPTAHRSPKRRAIVERVQLHLPDEPIRSNATRKLLRVTSRENPTSRD